MGNVIKYTYKLQRAAALLKARFFSLIHLNQQEADELCAVTSDNTAVNSAPFIAPHRHSKPSTTPPPPRSDSTLRGEGARKLGTPIHPRSQSAARATSHAMYTHRRRANAARFGKKIKK